MSRLIYLDRTKGETLPEALARRIQEAVLSEKLQLKLHKNPWVFRLPGVRRCLDFLKHQESEDIEVSSPSINFQPIHLTPHLPTQEEEDSMIT